MDESHLNNSVHSGKLGCSDCHSRITAFPHKKVQVNSRREYSIAQYEACKRCHFANYTRTLDGMHYQVLEQATRTPPCAPTATAIITSPNPVGPAPGSP